VRKGLHFLVNCFFWLSGIFTIGILVFFLGYVLWRGLPVLTPDFLLGSSREISAGGGIGPQLFNTFYVMILSVLGSLPLGLGAGIYLAEYARKNWVTDLIRLSIESLSNVPTIVLGLYGMIVFVNFMGMGFSILSGAVTLTLLNLPTLIKITEDSCKKVPASCRRAGLALGATRWQTVSRIVLPAALPDLVKGIALVASRALGEAALLIYTAGVSASRFMFDFDPLGPGATLAVHLWYVNSEGLIPDRVSIANGIAALLVLIVLAFNLFTWLSSRWLRSYLLGDGDNR